MGNAHFSAIEQTLKHLFREQGQKKREQRERKRFQCVWHLVFFSLLKSFPLTIFHFHGRRSIFFRGIVSTHTYRLLESLNRKEDGVQRIC